MFYQFDALVLFANWLLNAGYALAQVRLKEVISHPSILALCL